MKKIFIIPLILFILFGLSANAQDKAIAKIHYQFKHMNDSTARDKFMQDEVVTYLGSTSSYYTSYFSNRLQEQMASQMASPTFDGSLVIKSTSNPIKDSYLVDYGGEKMHKIKKIGSSEFFLKDNFPHLDWTITDESKEIGGYMCQKATTTFKGRNYEAWFCPEIPIPYGPWKLHGLPGLILAARDNKGEVIFDYAGFDRSDAVKVITIGLSSKAIESNEEEVAKLEKAYQENPSAFIQAQSAGKQKKVSIISSSPAESVGSSSQQGVSFKATGGFSGSNALNDPSKIKSVTVQKESGNSVSKITNNPIELTP